MNFLRKSIYTNLLRYIFLLYILSGLSTHSHGQCTSDDAVIGFGIEEIGFVEIGDEVCLDITAEFGFINVESFQFSFNFENDFFEFSRCELSPDFNLGSYCTLLNESQEFVDEIVNAQGNVPVTYFNNDNSGNGTVTVLDGTVLFQLCFTIIGQPGTSSSINSTGRTISGGIEVARNLTPDDPFATEILLADAVCVNGVEDINVVCSNYDVYTRACATTVGEEQGTLHMYACGGDAPYTFTVNGVDVPGTYDETEEAFLLDLPAGQYEVVVFDGTNMRTKIETVINGDRLDVVLDKTDPSCPFSDNPFASNNGRVEATTVGGSPDYRYTWAIETGDGLEQINANVDIINQAGVGRYTVIVEDDNGCTDSDFVELESDSIQLELNVIREADCAGRLGQIEIMVRGGEPPYDVVVTFPDGNDVELENNGGYFLSGRADGLYTVKVSDSSRIPCSSPETSFEFATTKLIELEGTATQETCAGLGDASYNYVVNTINGRSETLNRYTLRDSMTDVILPGFGDVVVNDDNFDIVDLSAGTYIFNGVTFNGCELIDTFRIEPTDSLLLFETTVLSPECGASNGTIVVQADLGDGDYTYFWSDNEITTESGRADLAEGNYEVFARDGNGCMSQTRVFDLVSDNNLRIDDIDISPITCENAENGAVTIRVNGDNGNGMYDWNDGNGFVNDPTLSNLGPGVINIDIQFGTCELDTMAEIPPADPFLYEFNPSSPSCPEENGSITIMNNDPDRSYDYEWLHPQNTGSPALSGIPAGWYQVKISLADNAVCSVIDSVLLEDPPVIAVDVPDTMIEQVACHGEATGTATAIASGGTPTNGYNFIWSSNESESNAPSHTATNLVAGEQWVIVNDGLCSTDTIPFEIPDSEPISLITSSTLLTNPDCAGEETGTISIEATGGTGDYNYDWTDLDRRGPSIDNLPAGTYELIIRDASDCESEPISFDIIDPPSLEVFVDSLLTVGIKCHGDTTGRVTINQRGGNSDIYSYDWGDDLPNLNFRDNLGAGLYEVTVSDLEGCSDVISYEIMTPDEIVAEISEPEAPRCYDEQSCIEVMSATGGTGSNYTFSVSTGGTLFPIDSCVNVFGGDHRVFIYDEIGCSIDTLINIPEQQELIVELGPDRVFDLGIPGQLIASVSSLAEIDTIVWMPITDYDCIDENCGTILFSPLDDMAISVMVMDEKGCIAEDDVVINVEKNRSIYIPNTFCPDDRNITNRTFTIFPSGTVASIPIVNIFDRYGNVVISETNLAINPAGIDIWDGRMDSRVMESGVYTYQIEVEYVDGTLLPFSGTVTLLK